MLGRVLAIVAVLALGGCGAARALNPINWFGGGDEDLVEEVELRAVTDDRGRIPQVLDVSLAPMQGGAILTATGRTPVAGWSEAELVLEEADAEARRLTYAFRARPPAAPGVAGGPAAREITAGLFIGSATLAAVDRIAVVGQQNGLTVRP